MRKTVQITASAYDKGVYLSDTTFHLSPKGTWLSTRNLRKRNGGKPFINEDPIYEAIRRRRLFLSDNTISIFMEENGRTIILAFGIKRNNEEEITAFPYYERMRSGVDLKAAKECFKAMMNECQTINAYTGASAPEEIDSYTDDITNYKSYWSEQDWADHYETEMLISEDYQEVEGFDLFPEQNRIWKPAKENYDHLPSAVKAFAIGLGKDEDDATRIMRNYDYLMRSEEEMYEDSKTHDFGWSQIENGAADYYNHPNDYKDFGYCIL